MGGEDDEQSVRVPSGCTFSILNVMSKYDCCEMVLVLLLHFQCRYLIFNERMPIGIHRGN